MSLWYVPAKKGRGRPGRQRVNGKRQGWEVTLSYLHLMTLRDRWSHTLFLLAPDQSAIEKITVHVSALCGQPKSSTMFPPQTAKTESHRSTQFLSPQCVKWMRNEKKNQHWLNLYGVPDAVLGGLLYPKGSIIPEVLNGVDSALQETLSKHLEMFFYCCDWQENATTGI